MPAARVLLTALLRSTAPRRILLAWEVAAARRGGWSGAAAIGKHPLPGAAPRRFASPASTAAPRAGKKWRFSAIILFIPCATTLGLGTWQLFRWQWKIEVLDYRRKRLEEEPIPLANAIGRSVEVSKPDETNSSSSQTATVELEFRTVICEGVYDVQKNLYVGPRARSAYGVTQQGYFVITPLLCAVDSKRQLCGSGQVPVLVNRGWVPSGWIEEPALGQSATGDKSTIAKVPLWKFWTRQQDSLNSEVHIDMADSIAQAPVFPNVACSSDGSGQIVPKTQETTIVHGVIRGSEEPNIFVPLNVPSTGQWFYVDVPAMARTLNLPETIILIEVIKEPNMSEGKEAVPIAKDSEALLHSSVMPQDHINYSLTWYSLSAATTFMAIKRLRGTRTGR